jgi:hypothetical protein
MPAADPVVHRLVAPMAATVASVEVADGDHVRDGQTVVVLEVMKMEHPLQVFLAGTVSHLAVAEGEAVAQGQELLRITGDRVEAGAGAPSIVAAAPGEDPSSVRPPAERADLAELARRRALLDDAARPDAVAKRHGRGQRTARENVLDLCDDGSFEEYGGFAFAAQESRRDREDLQAKTPADGLITGIGRVGGRPTAVVAYDYTVLAGTQGQRNHAKKDRDFQLSRAARCTTTISGRTDRGRRHMCPVCAPELARISLRTPGQRHEPARGPPRSRDRH